MNSPAQSKAAARMQRVRAERSERHRTGKLIPSDLATMVAAGNQHREIPKVTLPYVSIQHVEVTQ